MWLQNQSSKCPEENWSKCVQRFRELKMTKSRNHLFKKLCLCDYCMNEAEYVLVGGAHGVGMTPSGLSRVYWSTVNWERFAAYATFVFYLGNSVVLKPGCLNSTLLYLKTPLRLISCLWVVVCFVFDNWELLKGRDKCLFGVGVSPVSSIMSGMEKVHDKCGLNKSWDASINWFRLGRGQLALSC